MTEWYDGAAPIELQKVSKVYKLGFFMNRRVAALRDLSLRVESGQVYGLLGPNGAGKSTTIKVLLNLVQATAGEARLFGISPRQERVRRLVGFLPENPAPYEYLTGEEFVRLAARLGGLSGHDLDVRVSDVLGRVGMGRAAKLQIRRYSKGMTQRIGLAQAIVNRPKLLILDEPTSGLDPVGRREMRDLILEERQRGTTILFCTHIISDVEALCDRIVVLLGGRRVREGSVTELLSGQSPIVEVTVEGMSSAQLEAIGLEESSRRQVGQRFILRIPQSDAQRALLGILQADGRVAQVQPIRNSLEELFLDAMKEARGAGVGGEIS